MKASSNSLKSDRGDQLPKVRANVFPSELLLEEMCDRQLGANDL
jgi:hypothetical protein